MAFDGILGQAAAVTLLSRAIATGRVAHAYAFVGPSGVGRKLTALGFAQALLCQTGGCGSCRSCARVGGGTHPDCHLVVPEGQTIKIDQVRELARLASLTPHEGRVKVFIVDNAERMTLQAAHALLKTLEEPPARTVLVLILSQVRALPATILSRCQPIRFSPLSPPDVVSVLAQHGLGEPRARLLARACQGRVGWALAQDANAFFERRDLALSILAEVMAQGAEPLLKRVETLGRDRSQVESFIETYWLWYRDLLCVKASGDSGLLVHADRQAELEETARASSWEKILQGLRHCREAWQALQGNVSPRLTLEVTLARLALRAA
jgi:DNA polymerase-3 subunit delta'